MFYGRICPGDGCVALSCRPFSVHGVELASTGIEGGAGGGGDNLAYRAGGKELAIMEV